MVRRIGVGILTLLLLVIIGVVETPQRAVAQYIGPGGALAVKPGPKELHGAGYAVDGDTLSAYVDDQLLPVGLIGLRTPAGNTDCGLQATIAMNKLFRQGMRLEEDPAVALDGRKRRMYTAFTLDGLPIAERLVQAGLARTDGRGTNADVLHNLEAEAQQAGRGCIWQKDELQQDLASPSVNLRTKDLAEVPQPPVAGSNPLSYNNLLLGLINVTDFSLRPSLVLAQAATPTPTPAPIALPANFTTDTLVTSGLQQPTNFAFLPDGRILIAQKNGVVQLYKNGQLQPTPFIDIHDRVNTYFDHGLVGIAVDPNFTTNNYVYLLYTYEDNPAIFSGTKTGRLARYSANGDTASPTTEAVILGQWVGSSCEAFPVGYDCIPSDDLSHSVGGMKFAPDGTLFVTLGEGASFSVVDPLALRAQRLTSLGGKLLRISSNGQGMTTNPFYTGNINDNQSKVYAYGLRNAYRFGIRPSNNTPYIGMVGWNTWEDIYVGRPGRNFGWPCYEGNFIQSGYQAYSQCTALYSAATRTPPLISYGHYAGSTAVTGGFFYTGSNFPAQYQGSFFYSDYGHSFIHQVTVDANDNLLSDTSFMGDTPSAGITALDQGPDGYLYYVAISSNQLRRIRFISPTSPPNVVASATPTNGLLPLAVNFSSAGTSDPNSRPLTFDWDFGDGSAHSTVANPSHTYTTAGSYTARLTVTNNVPASNNWQTTIVAGSQPPTATIASPVSTLRYKVGDTIAFSGSGTDWNGSAIPASGLSWQIIAHHCPQGSCHTHYLQTASGASGSIVVPDHGDDVYLELVLTATNASGLSTSASVSINPQLVTLTFDTVPSGLQLVYDGATATTPRTQQTVPNSAHTLFVLSPQSQGQAVFGSWSDAGAQQHNIITPSTNASYTATFNVTRMTNRSVALDGSTGYGQTFSQPTLNILGDWTIETWFKDENPAGYNHDYVSLLMKGDQNNDGEAPYLMQIAWNTLIVGGRTGWSNNTVSTSIANLTPNAWHHAAATFVRSTRLVTIYVDGVQVAQSSIAAATSNGNSLPLSIGRNGQTGMYFRGKLDDVRIWNVVRTPAQIGGNFSTEYIGAPPGLVGNWQFNDGSGTNAVDNAGTTNVTLGGAATWSTDTHGAPVQATATPTPTNTPLPGTATPTMTPQTCPCTIFASSAAPTNLTNTDANALEVGVKFTVDTPGYITGIRFYKLNGNTGTHIGNLWTSTGTMLATAAFVGETATGWQQVNFASPVAVTAATTYVASYFAPAGHYAVNPNTFTSPIDRAPMHAPDSTSSGGNGVYAYSASSTFPNGSYNASNYWVDAVFTTSAPAATNTPTATSTPTQTNTPVPGLPTNTPTPTPTNTPTPTSTSTAGPSACPCTIFATSAAPSNTTGANDANALELGVKFQSDQSGFVTGVRFWKATTNTGTHIGSLWSSTGTLLAAATFTGESASGWQQVNFSPAVSVTAGTTYVASYHTNVGRYTADLNTFNAAINNPPLHALASGTSGGNGVYAYSANSTFPNSSYSASNYWVDVVFNTVVPPTPMPTNTPTPGPTSTPTATPTATTIPTPPTCPCQVWPASAAPTTPTGGNDANPVELGFKFRSDINGFITGIRFYKSATNTGAHVVTLWSSSGAVLGTTTAVGETASGWQTANFTSPVAITANTTYVASYHTNVGHYNADLNYFASAGVDNGVLHALSNASSGGNGVYMYNANSAFPSNSYSSTNYWVDVVFTP